MLCRCMEIGLSLDDAGEEIIQWIQVRLVGRPHVGGHVVVKIVSEPFLDDVGRVRELRLFEARLVFLVPLLRSRASRQSPTPPRRQLH